MSDIDYTANLSGSLRLSSNGIWIHEGEPFQNEKLAKLFHRSIVWDAKENRFYLQIGRQRAAFSWEDTVYFVTSVDLSGDPVITLADETQETLNLSSMICGSDGSIYCTLRSGHRAKFLRNSHQQLIRHAVDDRRLFINGIVVNLLKEA
ncbi:MAG: DUF1285 domain-containing protein [Deltaproteobacteria bacterium]|nr:DUF1285 domain-containing protein [Deltaproteobacteria bacterium]